MQGIRGQPDNIAAFLVAGIKAPVQNQRQTVDNGGFELIVLLGQTHQDLETFQIIGIIPLEQPLAQKFIQGLAGLVF